MPVAVGDSSRQRGERGHAEEAEGLHGDVGGLCFGQPAVCFVPCRVTSVVVVVVKTGGAYRLAIALQKE